MTAILYTVINITAVKLMHACAPLEAAFIKRCTIWASNPYASIAQHADMIA